MTKDEKIALIADMHRNLTRYDAEKYAPHLIDGMLQQPSSCFIKSTLRGQPAASNGHYVMVFQNARLLDQLPEFRAEAFHRTYDNFDATADAVLVSEPIQPLLYDDEGMTFDNTASIKRTYFDMFWIAYRNKGLRFEQDRVNPSSPILVYENDNLVGIVMPYDFASGPRDEEIRNCLRGYMLYLLQPTDEEMGPCEKCGGTQDVGIFGRNVEIGTEGYPICEWCHSDTEGFTEWLTEECRKALEESGEYEKLPDGKYRRIEK